MFPSGPRAISVGRLFGVGTGNSVICPLGVILPTLFPITSTNQRFPSGPTAIPSGWLFGLETLQDVAEELGKPLCQRRDAPPPFGVPDRVAAAAGHVVLPWTCTA